jgi:hypothetical protein
MSKKFLLSIIDLIDFKIYYFYRIGRMAKSGLVLQWNKKFDVKGNDCLYPLVVHAGDVKKIGLAHMIGCFFILGIGLLMGFISLFTEIFKSKHRLKQSGVQMKIQNSKQKFGKWEKLKNFYRKMNEGSLYNSWVNTTNSLVASTGRNPTKLRFNYPNFKGEDGKNFPTGWGDPNRARNFNNQFGGNYKRGPTVFGGKEQQTTYNSKDNYNYFSYDTIKSNYKSNY